MSEWKKVDPSHKPIVQFQGVLPKKLYRFRTLSPQNLKSRIDFELIDEAVYLAGLKDLNDPNEGRQILNFSQNKSTVTEYWKKAIDLIKPTLSTEERAEMVAKNTAAVLRSAGVIPRDIAKSVRHTFEHAVRIACFTTQPANNSMWANYVKYLHPELGPIDHGGICIEYDCNESWRQTALHPVKYSSKIPKILVDQSSEFDRAKAFYIKSKEWTGEQEWRIVSFLQSQPPFENGFDKNSKIRMMNAVTSVIFGLKTPEPVVQAITEQVKSKRPNFVFNRCHIDPLTFQQNFLTLE